MNNKVSINRKKVLGAYLDAQNKQLIPEDIYFWAGVCLSVILPQGVFFAYGGTLPLIAFMFSVSAGLAAGLVRFYWFPYRPLSCVGAADTAQVPPRVNASRVKAA